MARRNPARNQQANQATANSTPAQPRQHITTQYGTTVNTTGLTPEQVKRVQAISANGAYGTKAQALAKALRKKNLKRGVGATPETPMAPAPTPNTGLDPNAGNAGIDPNTGMINPNDFFGAAPDLVSSENLQGNVNEARDAAYNYTTKNYARDKAREIEEAQQNLAERGIPIDPTPGSLWQKTLSGIDEKYQSMDDQAKNLAISQGNEILGTQGGLANNAFSAFSQAALGISQADMAKYGIDQDTMVKLKALLQQKQLANKSSGGGGSSSGGGSQTPVIGGMAPGF